MLPGTRRSPRRCPGPSSRRSTRASTPSSSSLRRSSLSPSTAVGAACSGHPHRPASGVSRQAVVTALTCRMREQAAVTGLGPADRHPQGSVAVRAARRIASADTSMSRPVVVALDTETRMSRWPCHVVPPTQHVPSRWTVSTMVSVRLGSPTLTSTWLRTTSLWTVAPPAARRSAMRTARAHDRSTRSATPSVPRLPQGGPDRESPCPS